MYGRRPYSLLLTEAVVLKQSGKVALGGIMGALSLMIMFLTAFPYMTYALPAIAGAVLIPVVIELGSKWAWMVYACVSFLSLLIAPSLEAKVMFIAFFGYYPIVKALLERQKNRVLEWVLKYLVFNVAVVSAYLLSLRFFGLDADSFVIFGFNVPLVFLLLGNVVFLLYDLALRNVAEVYIRVLRPKLNRMFK